MSRSTEVLCGLLNLANREGQDFTLGEKFFKGLDNAYSGISRKDRLALFCCNLLQLQGVEQVRSIETFVEPCAPAKVQLTLVGEIGF